MSYDIISIVLVLSFSVKTLSWASNEDFIYIHIKSLMPELLLWYAFILSIVLVLLFPE